MKVIKNEPHDYQVDQQIFFVNEKFPFTIQAASENFLICTRSIVKDDEKWLPKKLSEYDNDAVVHTIVDFDNNLRGPNNLVFESFTYKTKENCEKALHYLENDKMEVSTRRGIELKIDKYKTIVNLHKSFGLLAEDRS